MIGVHVQKLYMCAVQSSIPWQVHKFPRLKWEIDSFANISFLAVTHCYSIRMKVVSAGGGMYHMDTRQITEKGCTRRLFTQ